MRLLDRYLRIALIVVVLTPMSWLTSAAVNASTTAGLPASPVVGQYAYTPWVTKFFTVGNKELAYSLKRANLASTPQTFHTWPAKRVAVRSRSLLVWSGVEWAKASAWIEVHGLFNLWGVNCKVQYRYDGFEVWTDASNMCTPWGIGFSTTIRDVVTWNDGGANWGHMDYGADWTVTVISDLLPAQIGHWMRQSIDVNGGLGELRFQ